MKIKANEIKLVPIDEIIFNPKNNNKHSPDQIAHLQKVIKYNGFRNPITISNRSGFLVCGEGRVQAAKLLGMKELPAMFQDFENEAQEYAHLTADNAIQRQSMIDFASVNSELLNLGPDFDIDWLGIHDFKLDLSEKEPIEKPVEEKETEHECPACGFKF